MHPAAEAARRLKPLLHAQAKALREGRADDLRELNPRIQHALGVLSALALGPLPASLIEELANLKSLVHDTQAWVARRRAGVDQMLEAMTLSHSALEQRRQMQTYGGRGGFAASGMRGSGFGSA